MPEVIIRDTVWRNFVAAARKRRKEPHSLVQHVLTEYVRRVSDEELLERSSRAARRARFRLSDTEEVVRKYRRKP